MMLLLLILVLLGLSAVSYRWGTDSRDGRDWTRDDRPRAAAVVRPRARLTLLLRPRGGRYAGHGCFLEVHVVQRLR